jgi:hypothetical protein
MHSRKTSIADSIGAKPDRARLMAGGRKSLVMRIEGGDVTDRVASSHARQQRLLMLQAGGTQPFGKESMRGCRFSGVEPEAAACARIGTGPRPGGTAR